MAGIPSFEVPPQVRHLAESSLEQARSAFASFTGAARRTTDTVQGSTEFARTNTQTWVTRSLDYAEQNVRAALGLAQKLAAARSIPEATQIQAEFVRERFAAMQAQAQDLNTLTRGALGQGIEHTRAAAQQGAIEAQKAVEQTAP